MRVQVPGLVLLLATSVVAAQGSALRLTLPTAPGDAVVASGFEESELALLRQLDPDLLQQRLSVFVGASDPVPPMLGTVTLERERLLFTPRFPFLPRQEYRVVLQGVGLRLEDHFTLAQLSSAAARVEGVTPSAGSVPENLLRIYIHFSRPMRGGDVYRRIRLLDERGDEVEQAFVETVPELWDRDRRRLTLIFHPGRIKRGLEMGERQGPALRSGGRVRLRVEATMEDAVGRPLESAFDHVLEVAAADRRSPSIAAWTLGRPVAGSRDALSVGFDEALDRELLRRLIAIEDAQGSALAGEIEIGPDGRSWQFMPQLPWRQGSHSLTIHPTLEDLAGNRLDRLFDVEGASAGEIGEPEMFRIDFEVEPQDPRGIRGADS